MRFGEETNILSLFAGNEFEDYKDLPLLQGGNRQFFAGEILSEYLRKPTCPLKGGPIPKESSLPKFQTLFFNRHLSSWEIRSRDVFRCVEISDDLATYHGRDGLVQSEVQDPFGRVSRHLAKP